MKIEKKTGIVSHELTASPSPQVGSCQSLLEPSCFLLKVLPLSTGLLCNLVTRTEGSAEERKMCEEELLGNSE